MFLSLFVSLHGAGHGSVLQLLVRFVKLNPRFSLRKELGSCSVNFRTGSGAGAGGKAVVKISLKESS
tara:strand:+ start:1168 stop:1368 length:201 start_codon:yes stop_codon:yes gene_type:complete